MPELPEVETTRLSIAPYINNQKIHAVVVRHHGLRWPVPKDLNKLLSGQVINDVKRRGKYLLLETDIGTLIIHLGMSGSLQILPREQPAKKHDHIDIIFENGNCLRFTDPRRFGSILWTEDLVSHRLLIDLGVEPLEAEFTGDYLYQKTRHRKVAIKLLIMNHLIVVGVGNIYANEALFIAKINPKRIAQKITQQQAEQLVRAIKKILKQAIEKGGSTVRNFLSDGKPGYFAQQLKVYGRGGLPCLNCKTLLKEIRLGQRTTVYCPQCQK